MPKGAIVEIGRVAKCPQCGRQFYVPNVKDWAYTSLGQERRLLCSYHCRLEYCNLDRNGFRKICQNCEKKKRCDHKTRSRTIGCPEWELAKEWNRE